MYRYTFITLTSAVFLISACGGGSSSGSSGDATGQGTTGATTSATAGGTAGDGTHNQGGGNSGMLSDIVGMWDASSTGDQGRAEYWNIQADGAFNAYVYRDFKRLFLPAEMENLDVVRCFENQENTITSAGNGVYQIEGLFGDERYGGTFEFALNANDTLQAKYNGDLLACGSNGCSPESIVRAYPRANANFNPDELFLCPSVIGSVDLLITQPTGLDNNAYWECSFVNQDDRTAEAATANLTIGADARGDVTVNDVVREFSWFTRQDSDLGADYADGSGGFNLNNLIFYSESAPNDRFTALDSSIRVSTEDGTLSTTYFEMDCNKREAQN